MKTIVTIGKSLALLLVLSLFAQTKSYGQLSVPKEWQQRMHEIIPKLMERWESGFYSDGPDFLKTLVPFAVDMTQDEFIRAKFTPIASLILDYPSFVGLSSESNLEFLLKLDTTRFSCSTLDKKQNKYVVYCRGAFKNGRWGTGGISSFQLGADDFVEQLDKKNISLNMVWVKYADTPTGSEMSFNFYYENGRLMTMIWGKEARPLLDVLLEYQKERLGNPDMIM